MQRRRALAAAATIALLGTSAAVAWAAIGGDGILGFGHAGADEKPVMVDSTDVPTSADTTVAPSTTSAATLPPVVVTQTTEVVDIVVVPTPQAAPAETRSEAPEQTSEPETEPSRPTPTRAATTEPPTAPSTEAAPPATERAPETTSPPHHDDDPVGDDEHTSTTAERGDPHGPPTVATSGPPRTDAPCTTAEHDGCDD
jgi:hypothetical protein